MPETNSIFKTQRRQPTANVFPNDALSDCVFVSKKIINRSLIHNYRYVSPQICQCVLQDNMQIMIATSSIAPDGRQYLWFGKLYPYHPGNTESMGMLIDKAF